MNKNIPEPVMMFLTRIKGKIKRGEYSQYLTLPLASKELLYAIIEEKVESRLEEGVNPLLTDKDIMECVQCTLTTAVELVNLYLTVGILEKTENGYDLTEKGRLAIKATDKKPAYK